MEHSLSKKDEELQRHIEFWAMCRPLPGVSFEDRVAQMDETEKQMVKDEQLYVRHCEKFATKHPMPDMSYKQHFEQLMHSTRERRGFFQELENKRRAKGKK